MWNVGWRDILFLAAIFTIAITQPAAGAEECKTRYGLGPPCKFPFRLNGEMHYECTTKYRRDSSDAMCPTKLNNELSREASRNSNDWGVCDQKCDLQHYRTNEELQQKLQDLAFDYPDLAVPFVIGISVKGEPLMGIRITRGVRSARVLNKPMIRFIANMHGNEPVGREILTHLAYYLLSSYDTDREIKELVDNTDISLLPSLNPDGFTNAKPGECSGNDKKSGASNANDVNLNKDFPTLKDWIRFNKDYNFSPYEGRQPETEAVIHWSATNPFVMSANLGDGAVLVTYPFDFQQNRRRVGVHETPDSDLFVHMSDEYAGLHGTMKNVTKCFRRADRGFANGAEWHGKNTGGKAGGSLKDFSYMFTNNLEISLELTCCKFPSRYFLLREWENNKQSLINFIQQVHTGIKGVVFGADGNPAENADIVVWNPDGSRRTKNVTTFATGEFWRMVIPGNRINSVYKIQAFYDDCEGSGRRYASLQHKVLVTKRSPLVTKNLFMRHVGFCGISNLAQTDNVNRIVLDFVAQQRGRETSRPAYTDYSDYYQNINFDDELEDYVFS